MATATTNKLREHDPDPTAVHKLGAPSRYGLAEVVELKMRKLIYIVSATSHGSENFADLEPLLKQAEIDLRELKEHKKLSTVIHSNL